MWLLNARTRQLRHFVEKIPDYVILSHTWADEEVSFDDIHQPHATAMAGYSKIQGCCDLAIRDGYDWVWIDTCCIDKRSSSELSEAINSMYTWYWEAAICYAYLSDVSVERADHNEARLRVEIEDSRWFKRGWTLQELLAPDVVEFYDESWSFIGTKHKLIGSIEQTTRIERRYVVNRNSIRAATIGTKLSWAAMRQTTRSEDMAYCLLGLVGANMPMLYGEGKRAFYRLQLEIIRQTNDNTIFAWQPLEKEWHTTAVIAPSPKCFLDSSRYKIARLGKPADAVAYQITNNGLRITLPIIALDQVRSIALLDCQDEKGSIASIWLEGIGDGRFRRLLGSKLAPTSEDEVEDAEIQDMYIEVEDSHVETLGKAEGHLRVLEIVSDQAFYVYGTTIYTQQSIIPDPYGTYCDDDVAGLRNEKFLKSRILYDNQAMSFLLRYPPSQIVHVVVVGIRKGRAVVQIVNLEANIGRHWASDMRSNEAVAWDVEGDYLHKNLAMLIFDGSRSYYTWCEVQVKKTQHSGVPIWNLSMRIYSCQCTKNCLCDIDRKNLKTLGELVRHDDSKIR